MPAKKPQSYVHIDESLCNGCILCMKVCPTKAIRVKQNRARIEGICIDCGECVRVCPTNAIKAVTSVSDDFKDLPFSIVSASTCIYGQFGEDVMPNDVLLGLRKMGFRYVHDQAYTNEMFNVAVELYAKEKHQDPAASWPLISPVCPVVVQLIAHNFPSLLPHIPPLIPPREIVAREAKRRLSAKYGCEEDEIKVLHITPCPAKMLSIKEPLFQSRSYLDGTVGICDIYDTVRQNIQELEEDIVLHHSGGLGLGWGISGGEVAGVDLKSLAVSRLQEVEAYLERIEMGLLQDIDYVEFRICPEGCVGGLFSVADKYRAKTHIQRLVRMFGVEKRVKYGYVKRLYDKGWFFTDRQSAQDLAPPHRTESEISGSIERLNRVERILALLPQKECGACGAPDCRTFAEDVVDGRASLKECVFLEQDAERGLWAVDTE